MSLWVKKSAAILSLVAMACTTLLATHNRAGEITYEQIGELTIRVTITTYTKTSSIQADRDTLTIFWGDGTNQSIRRVNGSGDPLENDIKRNFYVAEHTYPGRATYAISFTDPNRVGGIQNLNPPNSIQIRFHVKTTFTFLSSQFQGRNSSAILLQPPIDNACVGQRFVHNANAYDPDGDSLAYELIVPFQGDNAEVPNYLFPDQISPGPDNLLSLDPITGDLVWDAPQTAGEYNVAFKILEYRRGVLLNSIIRDMQILVQSCKNEPPSIDVPTEICVVAGESISLDVTAVDADMPAQLVSLSALGGPFQVAVNPAEFSINPSFKSHPLTGTFTWNTTCEHISNEPYNVVFRAVDNFFDSTGLAELKTLRIKVVGPPPENLQVQNLAEGNELTWDKPYVCEDAEEEYFKGFTVWRRENSNPFLLDSCTNGLGGRGYVPIGFFVNDMRDGSYHYLDSEITDGISYCYRITATFARTSAAGFPFNIVESLPSNEDCGGLSLDIPLLTKVSIEETSSTDGAILIEWTKPDPNQLDTTRLSGPYIYTLSRSVGFEQQIFVPIPGATFSSPTFAEANDTSFLDVSGLNTDGEPYSYQIEFSATGLSPKKSRPASSIYLTIAGSDNENILSWESRTPWENYQFFIFRSTEGGDFAQIATVQNPNYSDLDVMNSVEYCYYVVAEGTYGFSGVPEPLINKSQISCQSPFDAVPPCVAELTVSNACDEESGVGEGLFQNQLSWRIPFQTCENTSDVAGYRIYYAPSLNLEFTLLEEIFEAGVQSYAHGSEFGIAGCYTVTTLDTLGNESDTSNIACVDNCPFYSLPNVFTPNDDGANDLFVPFPYKFIERIDLKVFNRWGQMVFNTADPDINWNGQNLRGNDLAPGVYHYICQVYETSSATLSSEPDVLTGFIELIR